MEVNMTRRKSEEIRREEILEAALKCFSKRGYHDTRMDDIIKESGLSKGAIYWYFKGKRDIFIFLIEQHLEEDKIIWERLLKEYELGPDFLIKAGLLYLKKHFEDEKLSPFFTEFIAESYRDKRIRKKLNEVYKRWIEMVKEAFDMVIKEGKMKKFDTESLSISLIALIEGLVELKTIFGEKLKYEKIWRTFAKALLEGIQKGR
ncbi:MAG: TetR/AcrR family transcriptional regulator [Candidatus Cloacimonadota bacterium]|nr:MAG: TetR/AcrR family transcriptional regulator [Candidatus Cloacimonadota bacterium]